MSAENLSHLMQNAQDKPEPQEWGNVEDMGEGMSSDQIKAEEATINAQVVMAVNSMKKRGRATI